MNDDATLWSIQSEDKILSFTRYNRTHILFTTNNKTIIKTFRYTRRIRSYSIIIVK